MVKGLQSFVFNSNPIIKSSSAVGGPLESEGPLSGDFDVLYNDIWLNQDSFEKAEKLMLEEASFKAIEKANLKKEDLRLFISGDLMNQIISSSFAARTIASPYLGVFGACSSSMESLALAALIMDGHGMDYILAAASSHNASAEKQFRYPTEYGAQKPPTAQWTVTGAGACVLAKRGDGPRVTSATIGKIVDMGIKDPFNMGSAMAPAAVETILAHFRDMNINPDYYDVIATGDLGRVGFQICSDLLNSQAFYIPDGILMDCGVMVYGEDQPVIAGGSGCACSAVVTYGHLINRMKKGEINRMLIVATGALLSPLSYQQKESIPGIAHAVSIEM